MSDRNHLYRSPFQILKHALASVDARAAVRRSVTFDGQLLDIRNNEIEIESPRIYAVAFGKAATAMARGLEDSLGKNGVEGIVSGTTLDHELLETGRWKIFQGGHPLPNEASLEAARATLELMDRANAEGATVVALVSGGGSAMMECPISPEVTLEDLRITNASLVKCGASIAQINTVRRTLSAIKGGRLAARTPNLRIVTLIVSDTNPGDEANVASGPTLSPPLDTISANDVIDLYNLASELPQSILKVIREPPPTSSDRPLSNPHHVLLDNTTAIDAAAAMAKSLGYSVSVATDLSEQPIEEGCNLLFSRMNAARVSRGNTCVISGGEFSCPVRENGRGGRNLETALRCAILFANNAVRPSVVLSAGTDGIDGSSNAAGAMADETTISRARALGLDADDYLRRSDSHNFFERLGDLIVTGPTGTNVRDLRIVLCDK